MLSSAPRGSQRQCRCGARCSISFAVLPSMFTWQCLPPGCSGTVGFKRRTFVGSPLWMVSLRGSWKFSLGAGRLAGALAAARIKLQQLYLKHKRLAQKRHTTCLPPARHCRRPPRSLSSRPTTSVSAAMAPGGQPTATMRQQTSGRWASRPWRCAPCCSALAGVVLPPSVLRMMAASGSSREPLCYRQIQGSSADWKVPLAPSAPRSFLTRLGALLSVVC